MRLLSALLILLSVATWLSLSSDKNPTPKPARAAPDLGPLAEMPEKPAPLQAVAIDEPDETYQEQVELAVVDPRVVELSQIKLLLKQDPHNEDLHNKLIDLHREGLRDEVYTLVHRTYLDGNGAWTLERLLGRLLTQERRFDEAVYWLELAAPYSDSPFEAYFQLGYAAGMADLSEESLASFEKMEQWVETLANEPDHLLNRREKIGPEHLWVTCFLQAVMLTKLDHQVAARSKLQECAAKAPSEGRRQEIEDNLDRWLEEWPHRSLEEILD